MKIWGDQLPMEDMHRAIRTNRPQVVINGRGGVHNGHGINPTSGAAAQRCQDSGPVPDQIRQGEGLIYGKSSRTSPGELDLVQGAPGAPGARGGGRRGAGAPEGVPMPTSDISALWGISYVEMGAEGRGEHRSQGTPTVARAGSGRRQSSLRWERNDAAGLFDPKLLNESISALSDRFQSLQSLIAPPLASADHAQLPRRAPGAPDRHCGAPARRGRKADRRGPAIKSPARTAITRSCGALRSRSGCVKIDRALTDVVSLSIAVNADRHELVAGESFSVNVSFPDKPAVAVEYMG